MLMIPNNINNQQYVIDFRIVKQGFIFLDRVLQQNGVIWLSTCPQ